MTPHGEPMRFLKEVVLPYDGDECLIWPFNRPNGRYGMIRKGKVQRTVHRLVCETVNGPPPTSTHHAAHLCGRGHLGCVSKRHLAWKTPAENQADQLGHGTFARGEKSGRSKLTEQQVIELIRNRPGSRYAVDKFGICKHTYDSIVNRRTWKHVDAFAEVTSDEL